MRNLKYSEALAEATLNAMEDEPKLFLMGEGIDDPKGTFGTTLGAFKKYGHERVYDSPLSEAAITGVGIGAAIEGHPCVMIHMRNEFLLYAIDQIINHAAKWHYMNGGTMNVPIVIRCLVGRGWGQAAQHSQSLQSLFAHIPGLKVIMPAMPADAKGLLYEAMMDKNPVISIEHRWLYDKIGEVPEGRYRVPIGKANVVAPGKDVTCVAVSHQVYEALEAKKRLASMGIDMEVIDLRTIRPLDKETILTSLQKTGRLLVTDTGFKTFGVSAEIASLAAEEGFSFLKAPVARVTLPDAPTPCSYVLEEIYYPKVNDLVVAAEKLVSGKKTALDDTAGKREIQFHGPF